MALAYDLLHSLLPSDAEHKFTVVRPNETVQRILSVDFCEHHVSCSPLSETSGGL